jgi:hypothetical protein
MKKPNAIREITGRAMRGGNLCYQVRKVGRRDYGSPYLKGQREPVPLFHLSYDYNIVLHIIYIYTY